MNACVVHNRQDASLTTDRTRHTQIHHLAECHGIAMFRARSHNITGAPVGRRILMAFDFERARPVSSYSRSGDLRLSRLRCRQAWWSLSESD